MKIILIKLYKDSTGEDDVEFYAMNYSDINYPLMPNVKITVQGKEYVTGINGRVIVHLPYGTYSYTVAYPGFHTAPNAILEFTLP